MQNIMTVCIGNICRSPVAEAMLKCAFPNKNIFSAGLDALVGYPANEIASEIAAQHGIDVSSHRAQQITSFLCRQADLILVMEKSHKREIEVRYPFTKGKVHCLAYISEIEKHDIPDPYKKEQKDFELAHMLIAKGAKHWENLIKQIS